MHLRCIIIIVMSVVNRKRWCRYIHVRWCSVHRKSLCLHAHIKGGVAGPNEIQNGGQVQTKRNFLYYKPTYNGHNALAKRVYTGRSG